MAGNVYKLFTLDNCLDRGFMVCDDNRQWLVMVGVIDGGVWLNDL